MNVSLIFKWGHDPDDAYIAPSGNFKWKRGTLLASDDDAAAASSARKLAEETGGALCAATIGNGDKTWAAARGAGSTLQAPSAMPVPDDLAQAKQLEALVRQLPPADVVVMADAPERAGVAPALAALLGLPYVAALRDFRADPEDPGHLLGQRVEDGSMATLRFPVPALVSVRAEGAEKDIPTMRQVLAAKKSPVRSVEAPEAPESSLEADTTAKAEANRARLFEGNPDEAAGALVAALRADGVL